MSWKREGLGMEPREEGEEARGDPDRKGTGDEGGDEELAETFMKTESR